MNRSGLLIRLAVVMVFASLAVGLISAQIFYRLTYLNEVKIANKEISQLYQTVSATASIAAYLEDTELANEVVNGLITNGVVDEAKIQTETSATTSPIKSEIDPLIFELKSPFEKDKLVGELIIVPNLSHIENRAIEIAMSNTKALIIQSTVITIVAIIIAYLLMTKPMINIAAELHKTTPGTAKRIAIPEFHSESELGSLVNDVNHLLDKAEDQISKERILRAELEVLEKRFRMLFENSLSPIVLMELRGSILLYNQAFISLLKSFGVAFKKNFGPLLEEILDKPETLQLAVQNSFANQEITTGEYKLSKQKDGKDVWVQVVVTLIQSDDVKQYYQITLHDISKRRKELEQLNKKANFDQLTMLTNRHFAENTMDNLIADEQRFAVILIDLNGFKPVNDIYGHDAGDRILIHISQQLKNTFRRDDIVSRWGGDEFLIVIKESDPKIISKIASKLESNIKTPYLLPEIDKEVSVGSSIGIAFFPKNHTDRAGLVRSADKAMYRAKNNVGENSNNIEYAGDTNHDK